MHGHKKEANSNTVSVVSLPLGFPSGLSMRKWRETTKILRILLFSSIFEEENIVKLFILKVQVWSECKLYKSLV